MGDLIYRRKCEHGINGGHWLEVGEQAKNEWRNQHGRMCAGSIEIVLDPDRVLFFGNIPVDRETNYATVRVGHIIDKLDQQEAIEREETE